MKKHPNLSFAAVLLTSAVGVYFIAYFILVRREAICFDGRFSRFIPSGSLHHVESYKYEDGYFLVKRFFLPAHTVDVVVRPRYWSSPDNQ